MKYYYFTLCFLFVSHYAHAQYQIGLVPRSSPDRIISQKIGFTDIEIKYGSPSVKNRDLWGGLVSYNEVWRAGANDATTISLSDPVIINGLPLDSGKYSFFIIPKEKNKWTVIFNKTHKQWGAFKYDDSKDAIRTDIIPRRSPFSKEQLTYSIDQIGYQYGSILLNWGFMEIEVPFKTNYTDKFINGVQSRVDSQPEYLKWIVYIQGAEHLEQIDSDLDVALEWLDDAEKIMDSTDEWNDQFYPRLYVTGHLYWTKAKLLAATDNYIEAIRYTKKMKSLNKSYFFDRKNEAEGIDDLLSFWEESLER